MMQVKEMHKFGFGFSPIKEEGAPLDPIEAILFTGPGATKEWFNRQRKAFFDYRRLRGDTEEELASHPFYLPID